MALTDLQRAICGLLAEQRIRSGESYVAGGVALNELLGTARLSRDIDLFHDTEAAVAESWDADRARLEEHAYEVRPLRERPGFVEAEVAKDGERVLMEWARDSAYRFFPLLEHAELGLVLHPLDLATNKLLALVGRREVRDWVDLIECDRRLQPLGYLAWAASGKDPGFGPAALLDQAARTGRFAAEEVAELDFAGPPPDAAQLARDWHAALEEAREVVAVLPPESAGTCVLSTGGEPCRLAASELTASVAAGDLQFRAGSIRGVLPTIRNLGPSA
jgi:hypothetical protein